MQVNNLYLKNVKIGPPELPVEATAVRPIRAAAPATTEDSDCVLSEELRQLVILARQEPEVRRDRIDEAAQFLAIGGLARPGLAQETADAMLNAVE